jgi:hypothetical protein
MEVPCLGTDGIAEHLIVSAYIYVVIVMSPFSNISG